MDCSQRISTRSQGPPPPADIQDPESILRSKSAKNVPSSDDYPAKRPPADTPIPDSSAHDFTKSTNQKLADLLGIQIETKTLDSPQWAPATLASVSSVQVPPFTQPSYSMTQSPDTSSPSNPQL